MGAHQEFGLKIFSDEFMESEAFKQVNGHIQENGRRLKIKDRIAVFNTNYANKLPHFRDSTTRRYRENTNSAAERARRKSKFIRKKMDF